MERDQPALADEPAVEREVAADVLVPVRAVDEEQVERLSAEFALDHRDGAGLLRVRDEQRDPLLRLREGAVEPAARLVVPDEADPFRNAGERKVEAQQPRVRGRRSAEQEQRPAEVSPDLEDPRRLRVFNESHERDDLRLELGRCDANARMVEVACECEGLLVRDEVG